MSLPTTIHPFRKQKTSALQPKQGLAYERERVSRATLQWQSDAQVTALLQSDERELWAAGTRTLLVFFNCGSVMKAEHTVVELPMLRREGFTSAAVDQESAYATSTQKAKLAKAGGHVHRDRVRPVHGPPQPQRILLFRYPNQILEQR